MDTYISQLKNHMTADRAAKPNYFTQLKQNLKGGAPKEKTPSEEPDEETDPDAELKTDIMESKKEGYTLEDVLNAIDEIDGIMNKEHAKEVAKKLYAEDKP